MSADLILFIYTAIVFAVGLYSIFRIGHTAELHHLYYGMAGAILCLALSLPWPVLAVCLLVTLDDAFQHTMQLVLWAGKHYSPKVDPEELYSSPLHRFYAWVYDNV